MVSFSVGLLFVLATNSLVTALSLEDKWQELETKLDTKVFQLEEKVAQLETQLEHNVSFPFRLPSSFVRLTTQVISI